MLDKAGFTGYLPQNTQLERRLGGGWIEVKVNSGSIPKAQMDGPCEAGAVHLCSKELCDPHLHHASVWRMGPGDSHAAAIVTPKTCTPIK